MIHKLTHLTLIYANRHRKMNEQLNARFQAIEHSINNNYYQKALTQLLELLQ